MGYEVLILVFAHSYRYTRISTLVSDIKKEDWNDRKEDAETGSPTHAPVCCELGFLALLNTLPT